MLTAFGHGVDPTGLLAFLAVLAAWLLSIVIGLVWVFMSTPDGWKQRVRHWLVAGNLLGTCAALLLGGAALPAGIALCLVSLVVAVLLVLRNGPRSVPPPGPPRTR